MAKQDLVVKLLLDSGAFGNDLRQAERKAKEFGDKIKSAGSSAGAFGKEIGLSAGALGKFGGMLAGGSAVIAGVSAFKSIMESTSGTATKFQSTIAGFQGVLDTFQTSLATFDFSNFSDGLLTVFNNAKKAKQAIADMNFGDISYKYLSGGYKADLKKYKSEYTSIETTEERKEEITTLADDTIKEWENSLKKQKTNIINAFRAKMKYKDDDLDIGVVSESLAEQWMKEAAGVMLDPEAKKEWMNRVKNINKKINKYERQSDWNDFKANLADGINGDAKADYDKASQAAAAEKKKLVEKYQKDLFINEILEMNEKELTEAIRQLDELNRLTEEYYSTKDEIRNSLKPTTITTTKTTKTTGGGAQEAKVALGSITDLQQKITNAQRDANNAIVGTDAWFQAQQNIETYTKQLNDALLLQNQLLHPIEKLPELPDIKAPALTAPDKGLALPKGDEDAIKNITEDYEGLNIALSSSISLLYGLGDAFSASESQAGKAMGSIVQVMAATTSGIMNFIQIKQAAAAASGTASAAGLPFPYNLAAIATIMTTVLSVFANIKSMTSGKFAEGGIVGGTSYSGDKLFAMVNSGEMILNKRQQGNLANMIGGGSNQVEFHISGDSLVGVLNNKRNKTNLTR